MTVKKIFNAFSISILFKFYLLIPVWIFLLPVPTIAHHFVNAILCLPTKFCFGFSRIAVAGCNIAWSARFDYVGYVHTINLHKGVNNIEDAIAVTCAKVINAKTTITLNSFQSSHMARGQVTDMDIGNQSF